MPITTQFANQILNALLQGAQIPAEGGWIGLSSTVPNLDGTNWTELGAADFGNYGRASLSGLVSSGSSGSGTNGGQVNFPVPTVGGGNVAAWGVWTAPTGGTLRGFVAQQPALPIVAGRAVRFVVGALGAAVQ